MTSIWGAVAGGLFLTLHLIILGVLAWTIGHEGYGIFDRVGRWGDEKETGCFVARGGAADDTRQPALVARVPLSTYGSL